MDTRALLQCFPTEEACISQLEQLRWEGMTRCVYCNSAKCARSQYRWYYYDCRTSFSVTVGTVFHHTHVPLQKWFLVISLVLNDDNGEVSGMYLSRHLGLNKNTGFRMSNRIRMAMLDNDQWRLMTGILTVIDSHQKAVGSWREQR